MWLLYARIVVRVVILALKVCGIAIWVDSSTMTDTVTDTNEAIKKSSAFQNALKVFLESWKQSGDSNMQKGQAVFKLLWDINMAGFLWMIISCLCRKMTKWAWVKTSAMVTALIMASFGTGGLVLIGRIASAVPDAIDLVKDITEALKFL